MERITYRITLDAHRNGIQRTLQGFETADKMSRKIAINLVEGSDTFDLPMTNVVAMMYVTTPSAKQPSINECVIDGNTIVYDVKPITEEGITEMQLKVIETSPEGAKAVLISPKFAVEVTESGTNDSSATQTTTFTALEDAVAKASAVYESRILRVVIEEDCVFKVFYADGTIYENDYFRDAMYNGNALLSQSFAVGGAGVREGEDTDNSKYYSSVSKSASENARLVHEQSVETLNDIQKHSNYTYFKMNFETGQLGYISQYCDFSINKETGQLETSRDDTYTPEEVIEANVDVFIDEKASEIDEKLGLNLSELESNSYKIKQLENSLETTNGNIEDANEHIDRVETVANSSTKSIAYDSYSEFLNSFDWENENNYNIGQVVLFKEKNSPNIWISEISEIYSENTFSEEGVISKLNTDGQFKKGYFTFSKIETDKPNLYPYAKTEDVEQSIDDAKQELRGDISKKLDNNRLLVLEGDLTSHYDTGFTTIQYPEGFNINNCVILKYTFPFNTPNWIIPNAEVILDDDGLIVYLGGLQGFERPVPYQIVLLRYAPLHYLEVL